MHLSIPPSLAPYLPYLVAALLVAFAAAVLWILTSFLRPENPDRTANGIAAGPIKLFDNRFLTVRVDALEASLENIGDIDLKKLDDSVGNVQGRVTQRVDVSLSGGSEAKDGDKDKKDSVESKDKDAPGSNVAQSARDRLAELINLRYELLSQRLILERSLSDRFWHGDARRQAVLGLQISIDPPAGAEDCAAVVEVTFREVNRGELSIVALLPQERTSNVILANSAQASVAGGVPVKDYPGRFSWRRQQQTLSSVAQTDTVAFQRPQQTFESYYGPVVPESEQSSVTVGWQFRPLPGMRSVSPGERQVFAVIALPVGDPALPVGDPALRVSGEAQAVQVEARVKTYWRRYNRSTQTTSPRWSWLPWILDSRESSFQLPTVSIRDPNALQVQLKPWIRAVRTLQVGPDTVKVLIDGANFFPGTTVAIGGDILRDPASGLLIKSDNHIQVTTTPKALAWGNAVINGRYGPTVELVIEPPVKAIWVGWCDVELYADGNFHWLSIYIGSTVDGRTLTAADVTGLPTPIITVDDHVLPQPYYIAAAPLPGEAVPAPNPESSPAPPEWVVIQAWVPAAWNPVAARFKLIFPFCGDEYQQAFSVTELEPVFNLTRWAVGDTTRLLVTATGGDFEILKHWSLELDQTYTLEPAMPELQRLSKRQLSLSVPSDRLKNCERLVVRYSDGVETSVYPLPIPAATAAPKPSVAPDQCLEMAASKITFGVVKGSMLGSCESVLFSPHGSEKSLAISFLPRPDGLSLNVLLPAGQTVGFGELKLTDNHKAEIGRVPVVVRE